MLQFNLTGALPSITTVQRTISTEKKIQEGEFRFDELVNHLKNWGSPMAVHIHLDDSRLLKKVEYDPTTGPFVGFLLPLKDGLPSHDFTVLETFEDIENVYKSSTIVSYAHCIVAQHVSVDAPSFVLFILGTDSKYTHVEIEQRWDFIKHELEKRNVIVLSNGADGAGQFLKAMVKKSNLFKISRESNVPTDWSFFVMPKLMKDNLNAQDTIHLLAKLRTKLLTPSNIVSIGAEHACRGHLIEVLKRFPKARHGLTQQAIDNKEKQNYGSVTLLVKPCDEDCLKEISHIKQMALLRICQ